MVEDVGGGDVEAVADPDAEVQPHAGSRRAGRPSRGGFLRCRRPGSRSRPGCSPPRERSSPPAPGPGPGNRTCSARGVGCRYRRRPRRRRPGSSSPRPPASANPPAHTSAAPDAGGGRFGQSSRPWPTPGTHSTARSTGAPVASTAAATLGCNPAGRVGPPGVDQHHRPGKRRQRPGHGRPELARRGRCADHRDAAGLEQRLQPRPAFIFDTRPSSERRSRVDAVVRGRHAGAPTVEATAAHDSATASEAPTRSARPDSTSVAAWAGRNDVVDEQRRGPPHHPGFLAQQDPGDGGAAAHRHDGGAGGDAGLEFGDGARQAGLVVGSRQPQPPVGAGHRRLARRAERNDLVAAAADQRRTPAGGRRGDRHDPPVHLAAAQRQRRGQRRSAEAGRPPASTRRPRTGGRGSASLSSGMAREKKWKANWGASRWSW